MALSQNNGDQQISHLSSRKVIHHQQATTNQFPLYLHLLKHVITHNRQAYTEPPGTSQHSHGPNNMAFADGYCIDGLHQSL